MDLHHLDVENLNFGIDACNEFNHFTTCKNGASDGALGISGSFLEGKEGLEFAEFIRRSFLMVKKRNDNLVNVILK